MKSFDSLVLKLVAEIGKLLPAEYSYDVKIHLYIISTAEGVT